MNLVGNFVSLRAVEPSDASTLFLWENDQKNWRISHTEIPFSMHNIHQLIEQFSSLRQSGHLRLIIEGKEARNPIGAIDLYDVNFKHGFGTVGVLIADPSFRNKGYASEALTLFISYCRDTLELSNLCCQVHADNVESIGLFKKLNFREIGTKKNWYQYKGKRVDEILFQLWIKED